MYNTKFTYFTLILVSLLFISCVHKSGRKDKQNINNPDNISQSTEIRKDFKRKTIIKMENDFGVKYIWVEINGLRLKFIFDTGASLISISSAEATILYKQGTLKKEDILDVQYFVTATGEVSSGTIINLRTVKIGDRILKNVEAIVVDNNKAPLLLGQVALERFGKITIDNVKNIIILEW